MHYITTRNSSKKYTLSQAMLAGLAPDGGLFIPETFPSFDLTQFNNELSYPDFCYHLLKPFFADDLLEGKLEAICHQAFNFPLPTEALEGSTYIMELFHGPTLSFKDFGARFLAGCLNELAENKTTIMVATSGDTGSAVASAFHKMSNIDVIVLFPKGQVSERQQQQITCFGDNVNAFAVEGNFDDCQRMVKAAFTDPDFEHKNLCTANSINIGRLLPQICYYAYTSLNLSQQQNRKINFVVPSGNFGNVTAAFWAKKIGFPIDKIHIAVNANRVLADYRETGNFNPRPSIQTLANAMDVGNPSNFERLKMLFSSHDEFKKSVEVTSASDNQIKETIKTMHTRHGVIVCPHTATACFAREQLKDGPWVIAATADPCKFETIVEPLIDKIVPVTSTLNEMLSKKSQFTVIEASLELITQHLGGPTRT